MPTPGRDDVRRDVPEMIPGAHRPGVVGPARPVDLGGVEWFPTSSSGPSPLAIRAEPGERRWVAVAQPGDAPSQAGAGPLITGMPATDLHHLGATGQHVRQGAVIGTAPRGPGAVVLAAEAGVGESAQDRSACRVEHDRGRCDRSVRDPACVQVVEQRDQSRRERDERVGRRGGALRSDRSPTNPVRRTVDPACSATPT